jgi:hypothetical protein
VEAARATIQSSRILLMQLEVPVDCVTAARRLGQIARSAAWVGYARETTSTKPMPRDVERSFIAMSGAATISTICLRIR